LGSRCQLIVDRPNPEEEQVALERLSGAIDIHVAVPAVIGSGRSALNHKLHAMLHAIGLELSDPTLLADFAASVVAFTTDLGVESGLWTIGPQLLAELFPWSVPRPLPVPHDGDGFSETAVALYDAPDGFDTVVSFDRSVLMPGLLHIIHNATQDLIKTVPGLEEFASQAQLVCKLLHKRETRER
jgi:hypothetical protein